jgi:hypothetical protein
MKIREIIRESSTIMEVPLPADWDKEVFKPATSYKKKIEYAVARAQKLGKGSSRTAFTIDYQGRPTVLKVAHNAKGMAQNDAEAQILGDHYAPDIVIPMIDYDDEHNEPVWIHTEVAQKATDKTLSKLMKSPSLSTIVDFAIYSMGKRYGNPDSIRKYVEEYNKGNENDMEIFYEYANSLMELSSNFDVNLGDFRRAANWGLYQGRPVVIDLGFTEDVYNRMYSR